MKKYPVIIGRFEHIDIVGKLEDIPAKIDTGAYRSSIHASDIQLVEKAGKSILRFTLLGHPVYKRRRTVEARSFRTLSIRSSNGQIGLRYEIMLRVRLGYKLFQTSFTLSNRADNVFPVLIGRKALNKRFLVDPDRAGMSRVELKLAAAQFQLDEEDIEGLN